jgi:hypothetical protein
MNRRMGQTLERPAASCARIVCGDLSVKLPTLVLLGTVCLISALRAQVADKPTSALRLVWGVTDAGEASDQWLAMLRKRLRPEAYDSVAPLRKPVTADERAWGELIQSRTSAWKQEIPTLAELFRPIRPPEEVLIVIGNRGAEDAFTHDPMTIGFDLAALQANYGDARLPVNKDRLDRFFRHEFVHVLQKAWLPAHPWVMDTPLRTAIAEIWTEGLGNYYSLSPRWRSTKGKRPDIAARTLGTLEPRFVVRLAALACAGPDAASVLTRDLSWGQFERKWGALSVALWLEAEPKAPAEALRHFVVSGPAGVWELARRHLPSPLRTSLMEASMADSLCSAPRAAN